ncbi:MAG TPA: NapC/NirT family cytochrome c [Candidatus Acidoferrum sp.]|jgi:nitrate/TMAO reductase-like tetraheme cytochrome c subunit|nr:NapC/NirT family cytochrome c [Candidatus Acidoferrum sp.]
MNSWRTVREWARLVYHLSDNTISLIGVVLTTSSAVTLIAFWIYDFILPGPAHPYVGILLFLVLPAFFILGLLLIPIGILLYRRKLRATGELPEIFPPVGLERSKLRSTLLFVAAATVLNILIFTFAAYKGVAYMDSTNFCGQTCHTVMSPEFSAYQNSPHSRVECVECHIGPGAGWFVRAKVSGMRQVLALAFNTYSRPIPSPVEQLRPARDTCEHCHWPQRFSGDKFIVKTNYKDDEKNTPLTTALVMRIGGHASSGSVGIHGRHLDNRSQIRYISTDERRQVIPVVYYTDDSGRTREYVSTDIKVSKQELEKGEKRVMDCIDCHNRPTHAFELPENAVDLRMSRGLISPELPYIRKKAVELLKANYPDRESAQKQIVDGIENYYRSTYPEIYNNKRALVEQSADNIAKIYLRNIFPEMKVTWGVHPNNLGHNDFPGCFRCHDGSHTTSDGQTISNDCTSCHNLLAVQEENPKVLTDLGLR